MPEQETDGEKARYKAGGPPSNTKLAQRTARIETEVAHVSETVERIEDKLDEDTEEIEESLATTQKKTARMWAIYQFGKYALPTGGTVLAAVAAIGAI